MANLMLAGETGVDIHHEEVYQEEQGRHYKKQDLHFKQVVVGDQEEEVLLAQPALSWPGCVQPHPVLAACW